MKEVVFGNVPIIFPKGILYLMSKGYFIQITSRRNSDYKLMQIILDADDWRTLPDVMSYNLKTKVWTEHYIKERVRVKQGDYNDFTYDPVQYFEQSSQLSDNRLINLINMFGHSNQEIATASIPKSNNISSEDERAIGKSVL